MNPSAGQIDSRSEGSVDAQLAAELLRTGRPVRLTVGGGSMWPLVRAGDVVELQPVADARSLPIGALIAVTRSGRIVVHRLVGIGIEGPRIVGDATGREDNPCAWADVLGVVTVQRHRGRWRCDHRTVLLRGFDALVARIAPRTRLPWVMARRLAALRARVRIDGHPR